MSEVGRAVWLEERRKHLGASDTAQILSGNGLKVFQQKTGLDDGNHEMTWEMERGLRNEPYIAERWARERGYDIVRGVELAEATNGLLIDPEHPILACTPDYLLYRGNELKGVLEIKSLSHPAQFLVDGNGNRIWGEPSTDQFPIPYQSQVQKQRRIVQKVYLVFGLVGYLAVDFQEEDIRTYQISDNEAMGLQVEAFDLDWIKTYLEPKIAPPCDNPEIVTKYLKNRYPTHGPTIIQCADEQQEQLLADGYSLYKEYKDVEKRYEALRNDIFALIGDNSGISGAVGQLTWNRVKDSMTDDPDAAIEKVIQEFSLDRARVAQIIAETRKINPGYRVARWKPAK